VAPVWRARVAQLIIDPPLTSFALLPGLKSLSVSLFTPSFLDVRLPVDFFATISLLLASSPARHPLSATCFSSGNLAAYPLPNWNIYRHGRGQIRAVSDLAAT
jgi:hypothetical protein